MAEVVYDGDVDAPDNSKNYIYGVTFGSAALLHVFKKKKNRLQTFSMHA